MKFFFMTVWQAEVPGRGGFKYRRMARNAMNGNENAGEVGVWHRPCPSPRRVAGSAHETLQPLARRCIETEEKGNGDAWFEAVS